LRAPSTALGSRIMLQPGTILLDKYRVERVLGKGGMGIVVAARHVQLGELFALKMILPEAVEQPEALERFLREARACAKLKGEHVARVHDIGTLANGMPYMLMEHLHGEDLGDLLARRGPVPFEEATLYVYQACEAIAEAHANGIVHRDLKPSNLFLTHRPNGSPCIKVLDFGISKELDPNNRAGKNLTKTGSFLGSPMYMPPEQMVDIRTTDLRGDVWALGVLLYELVTGQPPFLAEAVTSVITKVLLHHPEPPSRVRPGLPPEFDAIVMRCLEKQPDGRYASAQELMNALEAFVTPIAAPAILEKSLSIPRSQLISNLNLLEKPASVEESSSDPAKSAIEPTVALAATIPGDSEWNGLSERAMGSHPNITLEMADFAPPKSDFRDIAQPEVAPTGHLAGPALEESSSAVVANDTVRALPAKSRRNMYIGASIGAVAIIALGAGFFGDSDEDDEESEATLAPVVSAAAPEVRPLPGKDPNLEQATNNAEQPLPKSEPATPSKNVNGAVSTSPPLQSSGAKTQATVSKPATTVTSKRPPVKKTKVPGYDD
jgi:serine/threonine protein kinase